MEDKIEVFILFDREDRPHFLELKQHLTPLETQGLIRIWDEDQIIPGTDWREAIDRQLQKASLILLLVSARFMASRESYALAKQALATHTPPEGYVIPILLHEVDWEYSDFGQLAPLPTNRKPISSWPNRHAAFVDVVKGIRAIITVYKQSLAQMRFSEPISSLQDSQDEQEGMSESAKDLHTSFPPKNLPQTQKIEPANKLHPTIIAPDGHKYTPDDVPVDTLVDRLMRDFLSEWLSMRETTRSMHFSLRTEDAASLTLDPSCTLREAGLAVKTNLMLVSEELGPNESISLTVEDGQREYYTTKVPLDTVVGQLADAFLETNDDRGKAVVEWILSATKTKQLRLEESLYDQGVCDDALLRIYRNAIVAEE